MKENLLGGLQTGPFVSNVLFSRTIFGGFWVRLLALVADLLLMWIVFYLLEPVLRPLYFSLGKYGSVFGCSVFILYVSICNSNLGGGQTVGKRLLRIKTLDRDGNMIPFGKSFFRALALFPFIYLHPTLSLVKADLTFEQTELTMKAVSLVFSSYMIANIMMIVLHPLKRGIHDVLGESFVIKTANIDSLAEELSDPQVYQRKTKHAYTVALITFVVMFLFSAFSSVSWLKRERTHIRQLSEIREKMKQEFDLEDVSLQVGEERIGDKSNTERGEINRNSRAEDSSTTRSTVTVFVVAIERWGEIDPEQIEEDEQEKDHAFDLALFVFDNYSDIDSISKISLFFYGGFNVYFHNKMQSARIDFQTEEMKRY